MKWLKIESEAIVLNAEGSTEIVTVQFDATENPSDSGEILLVLDRGLSDSLGNILLSPEVYRAPMRVLQKTSQRGLSFLHLGAPIDVRRYMQLPQSRRGFFRVH